MTAASHNMDDGLPGPIAETFGAFEPRFYGVSFLLETPLAYEAWLQDAGIFPDASGPHLPLFENTCLQTTMEHETRHFHDSLISPFANAILMMRMMAAFNGLKLLALCAGSGANCIPIPVTTWIAMSPSERTAWLEEAVYDLPPGLELPLRPPSLPHGDTPNPFTDAKPGFHQIKKGSSDEGLQICASATIGAYSKVADLIRGPSTLLRNDSAFQSYSEDKKRSVEAVFTPRNVFEASALAVQLQAAWTNIGEDAAGAFCDYILTSDLGYAEMFRRICRSSAPSDHPDAIDPIRVSAVAVWSLLGDIYQRDHFDPVVRLMRLLRFLENTGGIATTEPVADLWDRWDASLGLKGWRKSVKEMRERTANSVAKYAAFKERGNEPRAATIATVLKAYLEDQVRATELLLNDPDGYVNTRRYIEATKDDLPIPLINVELGDNFIAPFDEFPTGDVFRLPRLIDKDGVRGWNRCVGDLHQPPRQILLDSVLELESICKMCDVVFSDEALRPIDHEVFLQSVAKASGLVPIFVF